MPACENCGRKLGKLEKAYDYEEFSVRIDCRKRLESQDAADAEDAVLREAQSAVARASALIESLNLPPAEQEYVRQAALKVGQIVREMLVEDFSHNDEHVLEVYSAIFAVCLSLSESTARMIREE